MEFIWNCSSWNDNCGYWNWVDPGEGGIWDSLLLRLIKLSRFNDFWIVAGVISL